MPLAHQKRMILSNMDDHNRINQTALDCQKFDCPKRSKQKRKPRTKRHTPFAGRGVAFGGRVCMRHQLESLLGEAGALKCSLCRRTDRSAALALHGVGVDTTLRPSGVYKVHR